MSSLKNLAIRGAAWTLIGYGGSQFIRFGSNIILTRLLVREYFGLMVLINTLMIGLQMFSDLGIGQSIIQNKRGEDPVFLNTVWTIQVMRGFALWLFACIVAYPFAKFYGEPQLAWLIPISSLTAIIAGFNSTALFTSNRHLELGKLTILEIIIQIVNIIVMVSWALVSPSVWALIAGGLTGSLTKMIGSHIWLDSISHRFTWEPEAVKSLLKFGKWIFISTLMGFFLNHADRLILGKFLTLGDLGVYSIASYMAKFVQQIYQRIKQKVLFPIYSKLNHLPSKALRSRVTKVKLTFIVILLPPLCCLTIFGPDIVRFLYPPEFYDAGWMLQILAAGLIVQISSEIGPFYLAYGNSFLMMQILAIRTVLLLGGMIIGAMIADKVGLIVGIAASNLLLYPFQVWIYRRYSLWIAQLDALGLFGSATIIGTGLWLRNQFP